MCTSAHSRLPEAPTWGEAARGRGVPMHFPPGQAEIQTQPSAAGGMLGTPRPGRADDGKGSR